jgi:hypothetical protein
MPRAVLALAALAILPHYSFAGDAPLTPGLAKLLEEGTKARDRALAAQVARLDEITAQLDGVKNAAIKPAAADGRTAFPSQAARWSLASKLPAQVDDALAKVRAIQPDGLPAVTNTVESATVGSVGHLPGRHAKVLQVIKDGAALAEISYPYEGVVGDGTRGGSRTVRLSSRVRVLLRGIPTKGMADGQVVDLDQIFEVIGAHRFDTGRTVMALQAIDPEAANSARDKARAAWPAIVKPVEERALKVKAEAAEWVTRLRAEADAEEKKAAAERIESLATSKLRFAKELLQGGNKEKGKQRLQETVETYPGTKAAEEAARLLKSLN